MTRCRHAVYCARRTCTRAAFQKVNFIILSRITRRRVDTSTIITIRPRESKRSGCLDPQSGHTGVGCGGGHGGAAAAVAVAAAAVASGGHDSNLRGVSAETTASHAAGRASHSVHSRTE